MHFGVGNGHHGHGLQLVLVGVQWEVDINLLGGRGANMALVRKRDAKLLSEQRGAKQGN